MDIYNKHQAQQRADRIAAFRAELAELERERGLVLTLEQQAQLELHLERVLAGLTGQYGIDVSESSKRLSWGIRLASLVGAAALFAALVLFLHRIWGSLPSLAQAPILAVIPLLLLVGAEITCRRGVDLFYTGLLALAAGITFVMGLNAVGGIFNTAPSPHALLAWAAFAILVACAYGLRLLLGGGLLLLCAYTASLWMAATGGYWMAFLDHRAGYLIPMAAFLYFVPELGILRDRRDFNFVYRFCGAGIVLWALLMHSKAGDLCCAGLRPKVMEGIYQLAGIALSLGVMFHGVRLGRSGLVNLGAVAFVIFLYIRLHAWWWDWMPKYLFFLSISLIALLLLILFRRIHGRLRQRRMP